VTAASLVAGIGLISAAAARSTAPTTGQVAAAAPPVSEQQIQDALDQLDTMAADIMAKSGVPGMSVAVSHGGATVYAKGFGVREVGRPAAVTPDTVFQLASVSKSVGATVIASQVTRKKVTWNMPLRRTLPGFALADPYLSRKVTVADMYAHRSGLPVHAGDKLEDLGYTRAQVIRRMRLEPLHSFRTTYAYTNFGMTAGAEAVARAVKTDWATLSQRALYGPVGMTSTSSRFSDYIKRPNRAVTHSLVDGRFVPITVRDPDAQSPAGGVSSSANDMAKWLTMLLRSGSYQGKQITSLAGLLPATLPHMISGPATTIEGRSGMYGYGFNVDTTPAVGTRLAHSGAFNAGTATNFIALPGIDVGIVVLTNGSPVGAPEALAAMFADLVQNGSLTRDWWTTYHDAFVALSGPTGKLAGKTRPADPAPALRATAYTGSYPNAYYGAAKVVKRSSGLTLVLGPNRTTYRLRHWSGNRWTFVPTGESAMPGSVSIADFGKVRAGRARTLTLEFYNVDDEGEVLGLGVFRR
jgi:CubicO group peptidase (beta-lactamase class C family)